VNRADRPTLVVMVKAPVAGAVKSRLAGKVGIAEATRFYRVATAGLILRLGRDPRWRTVLAIAPDAALAAPFWPADIARIAQGQGDLGSRMQRLLDRLPPGPVAIVGSDIPAIGADDIAAAFAALGRADLVFGPAEDGGYWLVGARRRPAVPRLFGDVRWSGPHALADTLRNAGRRSVAFAATLADVDTLADYLAWRKSERPASLAAGRPSKTG